jgi:hypothetical protein
MTEHLERWTLRSDERTTAVWKKIREHLEERLALLRIQNDSTSLSNDETQEQRGRIAEIKLMLDQDKPTLEYESDDPD